MTTSLTSGTTFTAGTAAVHPTRAVGISLTVSTLAWLTATTLWADDEGFGLGSIVGGASALAFQAALIGLLTLQVRTRAMGAGKVARGFYHLQFGLTGGAIVSSILDMFWLAHGSIVWAVFDVCWPLSMLGMFGIGIRIAIAGRWTGALRWQTLFAQSWLFWAIPLMAVPAVGQIAPAAQLPLGYSVLGVVLYRRGTLRTAA